MAVTLMLFVRLPKAHTSAHVKLALKEMEDTVKVTRLPFVEFWFTFILASESQTGIIEWVDMLLL